MNILGINQVPGMLSWMHDSGVALVIDGKLIASSEEERFNRVRHYRGYPRKSIEYCLNSGGIKMEDLDYIAIAYNPYAFLKRPNFYWQSLLRNLFNIGVFWYYKKQMKSQTKAKIVFIDHHLAHAASAYRCSGFDEANVLTIDGSGETERFAFFVGKNGKLKKIWDIPLSSIFSKGKWQSLGLIYTSITSLLNLGVNAEGKTMGLASYGKPTYDFKNILNIKTHKDYKVDRRNILKLYKNLQRKNNKEVLNEDHKNLAASLQKALEQSIVNLAKEAYEYSKIKNFCLAGGVTLNCNTNSEILKQDFCDNIFIQPAAHDGGIPLGAALEASAKFDQATNFKLNHAYWGPEFSNEEIESVLKGAKIKYSLESNVIAKTAQLMKQGKMVAWFQGRMEIGPRALGNRSILADPTIEGINDKINKYVKHRESWRPFAPSVTEENASQYFWGVDKAVASPFMLHTFFVKKEYRSTFPAITHVDGSSRIQTVNKSQNGRYHALLKEMEKMGGYPIVLNTSFNDQGEPIICTPKDAVRCFFATGLDALVIGDYLVEKDNS